MAMRAQREVLCLRMYAGECAHVEVPLTVIAKILVVCLREVFQLQLEGGTAIVSRCWRGRGGCVYLSVWSRFCGGASAVEGLSPLARSLEEPTSTTFE